MCCYVVHEYLNKPIKNNNFPLLVVIKQSSLYIKNSQVCQAWHQLSKIQGQNFCAFSLCWCLHALGGRGSCNSGYLVKYTVLHYTVACSKVR